MFILEHFYSHYSYGFWTPGCGSLEAKKNLHMTSYLIQCLVLYEGGEVDKLRVGEGGAAAHQAGPQLIPPTVHHGVTHYQRDPLLRHLGLNGGVIQYVVEYKEQPGPSREDWIAGVLISAEITKSSNNWAKSERKSKYFNPVVNAPGDFNNNVN